MNEKTLYTINIFTENSVGLTTQVSNIFTRRKINIESFSGSPSSIKGVHKVTITAFTDKEMVEKVVKQIEKRIDVIKAFYYTDDELVYQEIALYKVPTSSLVGEMGIEEIIRRHNARILEITHEYTVLEKTGHAADTEALFEELKGFGIRQFVRSARVGVTKSTQEYLQEYINSDFTRREFRYENIN